MVRRRHLQRSQQELVPAISGLAAAVVDAPERIPQHDDHRGDVVQRVLRGTSHERVALAELVRREPVVVRELGELRVEGVHLRSCAAHDAPPASASNGGAGKRRPSSSGRSSNTSIMARTEVSAVPASISMR